MPHAFSYAHLNLRYNPFDDLPLEEYGALAVVNVDRYVERLRQPGFAVQFVGERGRGKTTHMLALREKFPDAPYCRFWEWMPMPRIADAPVLFLDEPERLPRSFRADLFRRTASFVIGTHVDHSWEFRRVGLDYETVHLQGITIERLQTIIDRRIEWARLGPGPVPRVTPAATRKLLGHFGDDVRAIEEYLYYVFQRLTEVRDVDL